MTYARARLPPDWPALANAPQTAPATARGMFASASTSMRSLPPTSIVARLSSRAQASPTSRPACEEPVKRTCAMSGAETSARAVSGSPWTTCSSPSGSPARANARAIRSPASAASGDGCSTTPLPPISAIATSPSGVANGSAPGVSTATTPSGSNVSRARLAHCSERGSPIRSGPRIRGPCSASQSSVSTAGSSSIVCASAIGRPCSSTMIRASSSHSSITACAARER